MVIEALDVLDSEQMQEVVEKIIKQEQRIDILVNNAGYGLLTSPFSAAYCASKASIHSFSDALRMELALFGIQVINAQVGAIQTNFGKAAKKRSSLF